MEPESNEPNPLELPPEEQQIQRKTMNEWWFVYGFIAVLILVIALTAYHLTHGHS